MWFFKIFKSRAHIPKKTKLHVVMDHIMASILPITGLSLSINFKSIVNDNIALIFLPLIAASSWIGGLSAGILTTLISVVIVNINLVNQTTILEINEAFIIQSVLFTVEGFFLSFIVDTLKHRERIRKYKKREKELNKKIEELAEEKKQYQKEIKARDEFLSIASHELKTPLTSMLLQTQTALHNIKNVSVAKFSFENLLKMLQSVEIQTQRLSRMINDLLSVSVITSGNLELEFEKVNLEKLVKEVIDDFGAKLEKEKIKLNFKSEGEITGYWDKIRIEQAIANFLSNAIKYGGGRPIEVTLKKSKNQAELSVADQGIGIRRDQKRKIFELFKRGVPSDQYKGLGIGLFITQKIVNAHGGYIEVKSKPGKGSEFKIILPIKEMLKKGEK